MSGAQARAAELDSRRPPTATHSGVEPPNDAPPAGGPAGADAGSLRDAAFLRWGVAGVWLVTAVTVLHPYYREVGASYLGPLGLPAWLMYPVDALELVLGLWVLRGPMSRPLAWLQVAMVATFSVLLAVQEPMLLVSPFGMLSKNVQFVVAVLVARRLEVDGWSRTTERILAAGMAFVWFTEGLFPKVLFQQTIELDMVPAMGLGAFPSWLFVGGLGVAQVLSAVAALTLPRRPRSILLLIQLSALIVLPVFAGTLRPELWFHPFGAFSKNLPIIAGTYILYRRCSSSS
jgi:hypothetical protein